MITGKIKGWNFLAKKLSADGSTTIDSLRAEKTRLEKRLAEIPGTISKLQNGINLIQSDITWLDSLNNRKARKWEKENGKSVEQAVYDGRNTIASTKADIDVLNNEINRIPTQIKEIDRQLAALVDGESSGLSKGISKVTAQQLGQMELTKVQKEISHEREIQKVELEQVKQQAQASVTANKETKTAVSPTVKNGIIIASIIIIIAIVGFVIYKRKQATLGISMPNPLKL